jgi:methylmalonyl-CoA mutase
MTSGDVEGRSVDGGLDEPADLEPDQGSLALADPADRYDRSGWESAAAAVLRKARRLGDDDPDDRVWAKLTRTTLDDIEVPPLGQPSDLDGLTTSGRPTRTSAWDVRVRATGDAEQAVADLETGATSLWLMADGVDVDRATEGVLLDVAAVVLDGATKEQAQSLVEKGPLHPDTNLGATADEDLVGFAELAAGTGIRAVVVDGTAVHEQGASDAQELGWILARGAQVLRTLAAAGVEDPFGLVELRVAATDEQFPTIAKLRALRRLWDRVAEASGVDDARTRIHAVTSRPMTSAYDVHTNMLRGTIAAFAAGVGGADAITVVPFDEPTGEISAVGRRIARNTHALLVEESHVAVVADPAGGAFAVERLTDEIARVGWAELGRIESEGLDAFDARVTAVRERREAEVATRRRPITGLTEFPNPADPTPESTDGSYRYGHAFEAYRAAPLEQRVFLATLGPIAAHTARATFATNLFAAGGVAVDLAGPTEAPEDLAGAYAGQRVVCLAGTDQAYADWGAAAVEALRGAGAAYVVLAGKPGEATVTDVDDSCAMGVDALAFLTRIREELGR